MKSNVKIALYLSRYALLELAEFADHIHDSMTGNVNFPNPSPGLVVFQAANVELRNATKALKSGDKATKLKVEEARYEVETILKSLASYVEYISRDNEAIALSSGFELQKSTTREANIFKAVQGAVGTVELSTPYEKGVSYVWE